MTTSTRTLPVPGSVLTFDVHVPPTDGGCPPLFVVGNPMEADGFSQLVAEAGDRTVVTYDPRGTARSTLDDDGGVRVEDHADDLHAVAGAVGAGPYDVLGSSGGAVTALAWAAAHPGDVRCLVAHEPPLTALLEDRDVAVRAQADIVATYESSGFGPAMAKFLRLVFATEPLTEEFLAQPDPDPAQLGLPTEDDGRRDDLMLGRSLATMPLWEPPVTTLRALLHDGALRVLPAVGASSPPGALASRGAAALARALGTQPVVFPGDHGGFARTEWNPDNDPAAFWARLRDVLAC
ncbi:alpha/beta fold hydrolase [Isoptericola halotolerans]|uniref:Pimeloyl-ACP methyl ester carboxylesterase n=1 Tax=Isoptericola halotolerans TaxID=300560 RepID=A0ABX2A1K0_9MICO|nr:alpha/beta hydrolase [Isoptericola halotolerans]NOV95627.1 pimeloyl-ACP methyl ester carboxylesterase [Isoptericola halotolerans]